MAERPLPTGPHPSHRAVQGRGRAPRASPPALRERAVADPEADPEANAEADAVTDAEADAVTGAVTGQSAWEDATAEARLREGARALGVPLSDDQVARLGRYLTLLVRWNARIKLTSVTSPMEVVERHFLDSLAVVTALGEASSLVDVGAGAGFPGMVIAVARAELAVTVVESIHKKAAFLEAVKRELGLSVKVRAERMEALVAAGTRYDAAVSRATFAPEEWARRGRELVAPGGRLIAMVVPGPDATLEALAPWWSAEFVAARVLPPYAEGRGLLLLEHRRG